jgi:hypothetical protein
MLIPPVHPRLWTPQQVTQIASGNEGANGTQGNERSAAIRNSEDEHGQTTEEHQHVERQTEGCADCFRLSLRLNRPNTLPARRQGQASQVGQERRRYALRFQKIRELRRRQRSFTRMASTLSSLMTTPSSHRLTESSQESSSRHTRIFGFVSFRG